MLTICREDTAEVIKRTDIFEEIVDELKKIGVLFERWNAKKPISEDSSEEEITQAYMEDIQRLMKVFGFKSYDVISMTPDHPKKDELRNKFLKEHTHSDFEVRFFVYGDGAFYLHPNDKVYIVICEKGDLISVPAGVPHWFDMGTSPNFKCIRLFTTEEGWVANYTGSDIADRFPKYDELKVG